MNVLMHENGRLDMVAYPYDVNRNEIHSMIKGNGHGSMDYPIGSNCKIRFRAMDTGMMGSRIRSRM